MINLSEMEDQLSLMSNVGKTSGCMFCDVEKGLVVGETPHLWLMNDKYPITSGHHMIVSKNHFGCMGELPATFFSEIQELRAQLPFQKMMAYEHGRAGHCVKLKGSQVTCHHFHLHFLPLDIDLKSRLCARFPVWRIFALTDVRRLFEKLGDYLFIETSEGEQLFFAATGQVESHLLRTLICEAIGQPERSDWETL